MGEKKGDEAKCYSIKNEPFGREKDSTIYRKDMNEENRTYFVKYY